MLLPKIYFNQDLLPLSFRQGIIFTGREILALQEIAHILDYPSLWVGVSDWEDVAKSIQYKLLVGENMSELSDAILQGLQYLGDNMLITQTNDNQQTVSSCCGETANTGGSVASGGGVTYTAPDTPPSNFTGTASEYSASRCYGANVMVDAVIAVTQGMSEAVSLPSLSTTQLGLIIAGFMAEDVTFVAGVGVVVAGGEVLLTIGALAAIVGAIALINFGIDVGLDYIANTLQDNRQDEVCALYNAMSEDTATSWLLDVIDAGIQLGNYSVSQSMMFRALYGYFFGGDYLDQYFDGTYDSTQAVDCNICAPLTCAKGDTLFLFEDGIIKTGSLYGTAYVQDGKIFNTGQDYYFNLQQCADQAGQWVEIQYTGNWSQSCTYQHRGTCGQGGSAGWAQGATINLTEGFNPDCSTIRSKMSRYSTDGTVNGITYLRIYRKP